MSDLLGETEKNIENLSESGITPLENSSGNYYCLSIIGQIEGHYALDSNQKTTKYDHVIPLLVALEESEKVDGIIILDRRAHV